MNDSFERALATLNRGAGFVGAGLCQTQSGASRRPSPAFSSPYQAKVIANSLRELDRFLNLLLDEALRAQQRTALPSQRNTANKLGSFWAGQGHGDTHGERLRALGRSRECLFHCDGRVLRGDRRGMTTMTSGWPEVPGTQGPLRRFGVGETLLVGAKDLADIGAFYRLLAREIRALAARGEHRRPSNVVRLGVKGGTRHLCVAWSSSC